MPKISPLRKILLSLVIFASTLGLSSCAQAPAKFADVAEQNKSLLVEYPQRIDADVEYDCPEDGTTEACIISERSILALVRIINNLQDEVEHRIDAHNRMVNSLTHCEYAGTKKDEAVVSLEKKQWQTELISTGKALATLGVCAALFF